MAPGSVRSFNKLDARKCFSDSSSRQATSCAVSEIKPWSVDETLVEAVTSGEDGPAQINDDRKSGRNLCDFSYEILDSILTKLDYKTLFQLKAVSKLFKARIEDDGYNCCRESQQPREAVLTGLHFYVRNDNVWRCAGYDLDTQTWMKLPPFAMLPELDTNLFKDHSICGAGGLLCVYVSAVQSSLAFQEIAEKIVVFNPLTGRWRELPPLKHPRNPVLLQMVVASTGDSFKIIVAGSARTGDEHLSKVTEVFDSRTSMWTVTEDVPGPGFALNEHQNGAYMNGVLYCVAFLDGDRGRGLLAYSVDEGKWLPDLACPLPIPSNLNIMQVANINGEIMVFSEIEHNPYNPHRTVEHRIDILQNANSGEGTTETWRNVMTETKVGSQSGLQIYPEYTCLPFGEGRLCIFNSIAHTGVIYDMISGNRTGDLSAPTWDGSGEMNFYSFNPPAFVFEPSFRGNLKLELTNGSADRVRLK